MQLDQFHRRAQGHKAHAERFLKLDIHGIQGFGSEWVNCYFQDCEARMGDLRTSRFLSTTMEGCLLDGTAMNGCFLEGCDISACSFAGVTFGGATIRDVSFVGCDLRYSSFAGATLRGSVKFINCKARGADLDFMETDDTTFAGTDLWGVRIAVGCAFFNSSFDKDTMRLFAGLVARLDPDPPLVAYAGEGLNVINRLMGPKKGGC